MNLNLTVVLLALAACTKSADTDTDGVVDTDVEGDTDTDTDVDALAIVGDWDDFYGGVNIITETAWDAGWALYAIDSYDNELRVVVAQNDAANYYNPGLWSRFDWAVDGAEVYVCQTAYDAASAEAAAAVTAADAGDLVSGCGGFSWTPMREHVAVAGDWNDRYGSYISVNAFGWYDSYGGFTVTQHDNAGRFLIAQNDASNMYNPGLWSRFDWQADGDEIWYCQTAYAAADEASALATPRGDDSDPANSGCGGFSWTPARGLIGIDGYWIDSWGSTHDIDAWTWVTGAGEDVAQFHISQFASSFTIAQNDAANAYSPDLWSRFDWAWAEDGSGVYYCQTAFDAASEAAALATASADGADLDAGCGGFSWTYMSEAF